MFVAGQYPPRVYVGYTIYKGKAALAVEPRPPEFSPLESGAFKLSKEGFILLQFAPAAGVRQYDWSRKQEALSALGLEILVNFFMILIKEEGVQNKLVNVDENIYIPITKAEFAVLVSSFNFILPCLLGWHTFANSTRPEDASRLNNANSTVDYEWNR
ncbi:DNA-binding protein p24 [Dorcoceras hygrometricum]|uniref:DNA-binding protein p24 n=1 Tax=Dorcoceras hygrometricum TaxID=472368 RepID=A0A2Z7DFX6_9LAMI|nr:DNA-binding protein p24 [Dorcoceras hygrometricum]